jgi:hypothetical protein
MAAKYFVQYYPPVNAIIYVMPKETYAKNIFVNSYSECSSHIEARNVHENWSL